MSLKIRISSRKTFFIKKLLPLALCLAGVSQLVVLFLDGELTGHPFLVVFVLVLSFIAMLLAHVFVRHFADEVLDDDTHLVVFRGTEQDSVKLSNIMNVNESKSIANIPIITLRLIKPSKFGSQISFFPVTRFALSFGNNTQVAEQLIERAHRARAQSAV